jgi:DNA polymerase elongation subunit (family B)
MFRNDIKRNDFNNQTDDMNFQIIDWYNEDIETNGYNNEEELKDKSIDDLNNILINLNNDNSENDDLKSEDEKKTKRNLIYQILQPQLRYYIKAFGVDERGRTVSTTISDFRPYFYLQIMSGLDITNKDHFQQLRKFLMKNYEKKFNIDSVQNVGRKNMYGFTNNTTDRFIKLTFKSLSGFKRATYELKDKITGFKNVLKIKQFESNIEPLLRFIHKSGIQPCGWIRILKGNYELNESVLLSTCSDDIITNWHNVKHHDNNQIAKLIIASYDIECNSSDGDFPMAIKTYKKTGRELYEYYKTLSKVPNEIKKQLLLHEIYTLFEIDDNIPEIEEESVQSNLNSFVVKRHLWNLKDYMKEDEPKLSKIIKKRKSKIDKDSIKRQALSRINDMMKDMKELPDNEKRVKDWFVKALQISEPKQLIIDLKNLYEKWKKFQKSNEFIEKKVEERIVDELKKNLDFEKIVHKISENICIIMTLFDKDSIFDKLANHFERMGCPKLEGDSIIQIGTTFHIYGEKECYYKHIITLGDCDESIDVDEIVECNSEKQVLLEWNKLMNKMDPDIITGYNIFGFDNGYMYERTQELKCTKEFSKMSRLRNKECMFLTKELQSSALGLNINKYFTMEGRVQIDLMKVIQKDHKLDTYKLDAVASTFMSGKIINVINNRVLIIDDASGLNVDNYIKINEKKYVILNIIKNTSKVTISNDNDDNISNAKKWGMVKDDISPNEIFAAQSEGPFERSKIAKYCIQDCALCNYLIMKLEIIANNIGMANVCLVPFSYIFMKGQGVKIFSLMAEQCYRDNFIIPVIKKADEIEESFEGAIVLDPVTGIYEDPIAVLDFASLYPSGMISENISHDRIVLNSKQDNLEGVDYVDISYIKAGKEKIVRFAQPKENEEKGILPRILMKLLSKRKITRKKMSYETVLMCDGTSISGLLSKHGNITRITNLETNEVTEIENYNISSTKSSFSIFEKAVLDGLQQAYKVTANSLYGQVGAKTSPIYMQELAASTTATGRNLVMKLKNFAEENYDCKVIYGDTDSVFIRFNSLVNKEGIPLKGKERLQASIDKAKELSLAFKPLLKKPHDAEYEKTFWPFIILSKKRYVGNLYEEDVNSFEFKSMGVVLKRRDNAGILKTIYGGMIDIILNKNDISGSIMFLKKKLDEIKKGQIPMSDLIITKTLRGSYADPTKIGHKVLADRMRDRDPGSAPQINDRVPYVFIYNKDQKALQGNRIENPDYIRDNNIQIDHAFYITNQIMKPVAQLLALRLESIPGFKKPSNYFETQRVHYLKEYKGNVKKTLDKINEMKEFEVNKLIFEPILNKIKLNVKGQKQISDFF